MNLTAIRQKIKNLTDYSPELQQFNDQLDDLVNDAFYSIWTMKRWNFATKIAIVDFHIDITTSTDTEFSGGSNVTLNATNGERRVVLSHSIGRLADKGVWEGSPISINGQEYTISRIDSLTEIILTEAYKENSTPTTTDWTIKKRYYFLPEDCLELLYFGHRDYPYNTVSGSYPPYGKATAILPRHEEMIGLRADYQSTYAEAYIPSPTVQIAAAETLEVAEGTGIGTFSSGFYEFCWSFEKDGKVGALSEPFIYEVEEANTDIDITFKSFDGENIVSDSYQSNDQIAPQWEGYRKRVYYNKNLNKTTGERLGLPCWLAVTIGGTRNTADYLQPLVAEDTAATVTISNPNQLDNGSERYIEIDGQHQRIRPYPRVNGFDEKVVKTNEKTTYLKQGVIRYFRKPKDLLLATDSPEMPYEFHQLIVYKALEDIYLKLGQQGLAATYERKYMKEIKQLSKRYVDKIDFQVQRAQFGFSLVKRGYDSSMLKYGG